MKILINTIAIAFSIISLKSTHAQDQKVPEIGWNSRLSSMGLNEVDNLGKKYTFYCQPAIEDLMHAPIWGTEIYTTNSGICSSAVHGGIIKAEDGGRVTIKLLEGQSFYTGSYKNQVTSQDNRATDISFSFINEYLSEDEIEKTLKEQQSLGIERVMIKGVQRGVERSIEKAIIEIFQ